MSEIPLQSMSANFDAAGLEAVKSDLMTLATAFSVPTRFYLGGGGDLNATLAGLSVSTLTTANRVVYTAGAGVLTTSANFTFDATNFAITGTGTFSTGTGQVSLNGSTVIPTGKTLTVTDLTSGRVIYSTTAGLLTSSASLTFDGTNFAQAGTGTFATGTGAFTHNGSVTIVTGKTLTITDLTSGRITYASTAGLLVDNAKLTFDGTNLTVGSGVALAAFIVDGAAATQRELQFKTNGVKRWAFAADSTPESGSNAGSSWSIDAYTDVGVLIDSPIVMLRVAGGSIDFGRPMRFRNYTTNGFVKTTGLNGTLSIDTSVYLTAATGVSSIAGTANEITASASVGAVTLSLPSALTFTSKTVTGGTFTGIGAFAQTGAVAFTTGTGVVTLNGAVTVADAKDFTFNTTTGTKIGTATTQKLAFFNSTPIVQPSSTTDLRVALINLGLYATGGASPLDLNGGAFTSAAATHTGILAVSLTTDATTISNGSSTNAGGTSITKALWVGGLSNFAGICTVSNGTAGTSTTAAALVVTGGAGIGGAAYFGGIVATSSNVRIAGGSVPAAASVGYFSVIAGTTVTLHSYGPDTSTPGAFQFVGLSSNSSAGDIRLVIDAAGKVIITAGAHLQLGNAYVATPQVATGYIIIKDSTGTSYKVSCNA